MSETATKTTGTGLNVFLLEDDEGLNTLIKKNLEKEGYHVVAAHKGSEAITIDESQIGLMLVDYKLPDMTARDLILKLKDHHIDIPFVVMTGFGDEQIAVEMMKLGAQDYIVKDDNFLKFLPSVVKKVDEELHTQEKLKRTEQALMESDRRLHTLMGNLLGMAYRCKNDRLRTMEFVSEGCLTLTGYPADSLVNNNTQAYNHLIYSEDQTPVWNQIQKALVQKEPFKLVYRINTASDEEKWVWEQGKGIFDSNGELIAVEGFVTDITERKQSQDTLQKHKDLLEEQVKQRTAELEEANEELSQYAFAVSHDLKSPLRAISNYASFLREDLEDIMEDEQLIYLNGIDTAVHHGEELVENLLKLSSIGKWSGTLLPVDMSRFLESIITSISPPQNVEINVPAKWPVIEGNEVLLRQIFTNLITNAIKFNESATKVVDIGWKKIDEKKYEIFVKDNGIGIESNYSDVIFQVFQRLHTRQVYEGTGIGLAIVKKAVNKLKGSIRVESEYGVGSTFHVTLPGWEIK